MIFFINIGPTLSSKNKPDSKASYKDFLKNKTKHIFNFQTIDRTIVLKTLITYLIKQVVASIFYLLN